MRQLFKIILGTVLGLFVFFGFAMVIVAGIGAAASQGGGPKVKDNSILRISMEQPIADKGMENPFGKFGGEPTRLPLAKVVTALQAAAKDDKIKGILIDARMLNMGMAATEEVRNSLIEFKKSKKKIYAYMDAGSEGAYYIASVADRIYLTPEGMIELNGLSTTSAFLKGMFAKLEMEPQVFRVGEFKSAVEPFILDKMSDANRLQTTSFLNSINDLMLTNMATSRKIEVGRMRQIQDSMLVRNADDALRLGIIDQKAYFDEVEDELRKITGTDADKKINYISLGGYVGDQKDDKEKSGDKIALVLAEGEISSGSSDDAIGADDLTKEIRKARMDKDVKAIVLRVNSPGGDALASDVIWREVELTKKTKPVIVSMGNLAASGGYYIAMAGDRIFAEPSTITGSIGVFGLFFNTGPFWNNKTGITFDGVKTGQFADFPNATRAFNAQESAALQRFVNETYESFTAKAAKGRNMDINKLKSLASGRVWTGLQAKENGLVDEIGSLDKAIAYAANKAKMGDSYRVERFPAEKDFWEEATKEILGGGDDEAKAEEALVKVLGKDKARLATMMLKAEKMQGIQARLPFTIELR